MPINENEFRDHEENIIPVGDYPPGLEQIAGVRKELLDSSPRTRAELRRHPKLRRLVRKIHKEDPNKKVALVGSDKSNEVTVVIANSRRLILTAIPLAAVAAGISWLIFTRRRRHKN